jgi:predicted O-methyltransferase YrrM
MIVAALIKRVVVSQTKIKGVALNNLFSRLSKKIYFASDDYVAEVRNALDKLPEISAKLEYLKNNRQYRVDQQKPEFLALLAKVADLAPKQILEIGGRRGGSALLFSTAAGEQTSSLSIDLDNSGARIRRLNKLCEGRRITFWQGDSHLDKTEQRLEKYLGDTKIDFLFIDGDHSYQGAKEDFIRYSKYVNAGGIIALHDIQPDFKTRFDVQTNAWAGGVPIFWQELKSSGLHTEDLISDPCQDGYGIGVVNWSGEEDCFECGI